MCILKSENETLALVNHFRFRGEQDSTKYYFNKTHEFKS